MFGARFRLDDDQMLAAYRHWSRLVDQQDYVEPTAAHIAAFLHSRTLNPERPWQEKQVLDLLRAADEVRLRELVDKALPATTTLSVYEHLSKLAEQIRRASENRMELAQHVSELAQQGKELFDRARGSDHRQNDLYESNIALENRVVAQQRRLTALEETVGTLSSALRDTLMQLNGDSAGEE